jgi:hypothetical protein
VPLAPGAPGEVQVDTVAGTPGRVDDLQVVAVTTSSVTLAWTETHDGLQRPAKYLVRYAQGEIVWDEALNVALGSCTLPVVGQEIGRTISCDVAGLDPGTYYTFQLRAYRGTLPEELAESPRWRGAD